jgi:hypothetical protein
MNNWNLELPAWNWNWNRFKCTYRFISSVLWCSYVYLYYVPNLRISFALYAWYCLTVVCRPPTPSSCGGGGGVDDIGTIYLYLYNNFLFVSWMRPFLVEIEVTFDVDLLHVHMYITMAYFSYVDIYCECIICPLKRAKRATFCFLIILK